MFLTVVAVVTLAVGAPQLLAQVPFNNTWGPVDTWFDGSGLAAGSVTVPAGSSFVTSGRGKFQLTADGIGLLTNAAGTGWTDLFLGTQDGNGIRIRKSGIQLQVADGAGNGTSFAVLELRPGGTTELAVATTAAGGGSRWGSGGKYCLSSSTIGTSGTSDPCLGRNAAGVWGIETTSGAAGQIQFGSACKVRTGSGAPEGSVTGSPCDIYLRTDTGGGAGTLFCVKESGSATNTGWVCK
jgi:hypothetical protein